MRKTSFAALVLAALSMAVDVSAQKPDPDAQKVADAYQAAFNKGDATALGALYAAEATRIGPDAQLVVGRAAIEKVYADGFAGLLKGSTLALQPGTTHAVTPTVKVMEGRYTTTGAIAGKGRYINTLIRQGSSWLLASVVTIPDPAAAAK
jgi:uncharacterized protein (TIGR02246 family)